MTIKLACNVLKSMLVKIEYLLAIHVFCSEMHALEGIGREGGAGVNSHPLRTRIIHVDAMQLCPTEKRAGNFVCSVLEGATWLYRGWMATCRCGRPPQGGLNNDSLLEGCGQGG